MSSALPHTLTRLSHTLRAFEPRQLAWRAAFVAERHAGALVAPCLVHLTRPTLSPVVADAGRALRWRRRLTPVDGAWLEALLGGWLVVHGHQRELPLAPHAPDFWHALPRHPDARHVMFELWSHAFAPWLAGLARLGPAPRADAAIEQLGWMWESWQRTVRLEAHTLDGAWHPWVVARRALHWLEAIDWLQDRKLPRDLVEDEAFEPIEATRLLPGIWDALERSARYLRLHLERDVRGNHLLTNGLALMALGLAFAHDGWFHAGARIWQRDLPAQLLADGVHHERSPMYHAEVIGLTLDAIGLLERAERVFGPVDSLRQRLQGKHLGRMLEALERMSHPDGDITLLGDSALEGAPSPSTLRQRARELEHRPHAPALPASPPRRDGRSDSGLVRLEQRATLERPHQVLLADAAPFGARTLPAHGHCDAGSFEYSVERQRLVVDAGTFCYDAGPMRDYFRGNRGHNILVVPGREQSDIWGSFRVGRRAHVTRRATEHQLDLVVRGYFESNTGAALTWRRTIQLTEHGVQLLDVLDQPTPPGAFLQLRLAPGTEILEHTPRRLELQTGTRRWAIAGELRAVRTAWYAPRFGTLLHVPLVELEPPAPDEPRLTRIEI